MLEIIAICSSCVCLTTCFWCAIAALTCPRIVNQISRYGDSGGGMRQSCCPLMNYRCVRKNFEKEEEEEEEEGCNRREKLYCPKNISYPILITCPMECCNNIKYEISAASTSSTSTAAREISSTSSNSNSSSSVINKKKSKSTQRSKVMTITKNENKNDKLNSKNYCKEKAFSNSSSESNSEHELTVDFCNSAPTPPTRKRRSNRLKSILKSKFTRLNNINNKKYECDKNNCPPAPPQTTFNQSSGRDKNYEVENKFDHPSDNKKCQSLSRGNYPQHNYGESKTNRVPIIKLILCKNCRLEKRKCRCRIIESWER